MNTQDQIIESKTEMSTALQSPGANNMWQDRTIISNIRKCFIEVLHHDADPSTWIVRRWKKLLWFKKRISSDWFINRQQAFAYAYEMKQDYSRHNSKHEIRESRRHAQ